MAPAVDGVSLYKKYAYVDQSSGPSAGLDLVRHLVDPPSVLTYNIHEAKTQFSRLLARVAAGEEVVIAKAGQVIAKIVPVRSQAPRRPDTEGSDLWVADDFDAELPPELLDGFAGKA